MARPSPLRVIHSAIQEDSSYTGQASSYHFLQYIPSHHHNDPTVQYCTAHCSPIARLQLIQAFAILSILSKPALCPLSIEGAITILETLALAYHLYVVPAADDALLEADQMLMLIQWANMAHYWYANPEAHAKLLPPNAEPIDPAHVTEVSTPDSHPATSMP
jgi:hypothetical protein